MNNVERLSESSELMGLEITLNDKGEINANPQVVLNDRISNAAMFKRHVLTKRSQIPDSINIKGCLAITRDTEGGSTLHKVFSVTQKIQRTLFGGNSFDPHLCHAVILLDKEKDEEGQNTGKAIMAESLPEGTVISSHNYLEDPDVTEFVIYEPLSEEIRDLIVEHTYQTAASPSNEKVKQVAYPTMDALESAFHRPNDAKLEVQNKRLAFAVADLLHKDQFLDKTGENPQSLFCSAYTALILQTTLLIHELSEDEKEELRSIDNREERAGKILEKLKRKEDPLARTFSSYSVCRLDARFAMPSFLGEALSEVTVH